MAHPFEDAEFDANNEHARPPRFSLKQKIQAATGFTVFAGLAVGGSYLYNYVQGLHEKEQNSNARTELLAHGFGDKGISIEVTNHARSLSIGCEGVLGKVIGQELPINFVYDPATRTAHLPTTSQKDAANNVIHDAGELSIPFATDQNVIDFIHRTYPNNVDNYSVWCDTRQQHSKLSEKATADSSSTLVPDATIVP